MKILVANLGSTSFKYRLFDMTDERQMARGGVDRIGSDQSRSVVDIEGRQRETLGRVSDHAEAVNQCLRDLTDPQSGCLSDASEVSAIGFKAVHGGRLSGVQRISVDVIAAMEEMNQIAPAHNPPYVAAMRIMHERLPDIPLVAAFETGFHATIPDRQRYYAVPFEWAEQFSVRRWGFHGASHRYIGQRVAELVGGDNSTKEKLRVISCHLGGSSSLCAIRGRESVATSMGMSPQSGLPQNNRAGDFDPFALPLLMEQTGQSLDQVLTTLAQRSGLLGLSGISGDVRDLEQAADSGDDRARLTLDVYTTAIRNHLGGMLVELGGADVVAFTGGIGENRPNIRAAVCRDLGELGIELDEPANEQSRGECQINRAGGRVQVWVVPTNEEIVVARQVKTLVEG